MKILVTGGAGFIGSALIDYVLRFEQAEIINVDKLTYAANRAWVRQLAGQARHTLVKADIGDAGAMAAVFAQHQPDVVLHLAAESHVDRSIDGPAAFLQTNLVGTHVLLETARAYWQQLPPGRRARFRLHHVSTDEVYGDLMDRDQPAPVREGEVYAPSSPYSASKAGADHLVLAWYRTYGLPVVLSHACNNYGPRQYPEKLIPLVIQRALRGQPVPIYGDGAQVRDWLHVDDHARALWAILTRGELGRSYHVSAGACLQNLVLVQKVCGLLDRLYPQGRQQVALGRVAAYADLIQQVADRPGHDRYYALDARRIRQELGWQPHISLDEGLQQTVSWYLAQWGTAPL